MKESNRIEIMSPAGSFESLRAAIQGGADSVYFGAGNLNMRSRSSFNFSPADLKEVVAICRDAGIKSYLTLNTVMYDRDLDDMKHFADTAKESGIDAVIASDLSVINYCIQAGIAIHISTQQNISNIEAVKFFSQYADVMVLARELNLGQVAFITDQIKKQNITGPSGELIRIEIFAHGALCMAVSGKCYLSLHDKNKSANRGACLQICRRPYIVTDKHSGHELEIDNEYIMSPKDLCTIGFIDKIIDSGVKVLKIEGRGRSPEYVKKVTGIYKEAVKAYFDDLYTPERITGWEEGLATVFNRGFWDGYYLGRKLGEWNDKYGSKATKRKIYIGRAVNYYAKIGVGEFLMESYDLHTGDDIMIIGPTTGVIETKIGEMRTNGEEKVDKVNKGDVFAIKTGSVIRKSDKLYKVVDAEKYKDQR